VLRIQVALLLPLVVGAVPAGPVLASATGVPRVLGARPLLAPGDRLSSQGAYAARITFTPDGDGEDDAATLEAAPRRPADYVLRVYRWLRNSGWAPVGSGGLARGGRTSTYTWEGTLAGGAPAPVGAYGLALCRRSSDARLAAREREAARSIRSATALSNADDTDDDVAADDDDTHDDGPAPSDRRLSTVLDPGGCSRPVIAHLRTLEVGVAHAGSFLPGQSVSLDVTTNKPEVRLSLLSDDLRTTVADEGFVPMHGRMHLRLPRHLASGLYRISVADRLGTRRAVPVVVRDPALPGSGTRHAALIVWPYLTWRAYDRADVDRDGVPDTWYALTRHRKVPADGYYEETAPSLAALGVESDYEFARPFPTWLATREPGSVVSNITDTELASYSVAELKRFSAVVFPGHTEYYTLPMYRRLLAYERAGGHVAFLSANNFFRRVRLTARREILVESIARSRARSDWAIAGVGFVRCCFPSTAFAPYRVPAGGRPRWLYAGTGLAPGDGFSRVGVEIDAPNRLLSPPGTRPVAVGTVHRPSGDVRAVMALTTLPGGGEIFSTGNMLFVHTLRPADPASTVDRVLANVWSRLVDGS
jgi:hypothetical protein